MEYYKKLKQNKENYWKFIANFLKFLYILIQEPCVLHKLIFTPGLLGQGQTGWWQCRWKMLTMMCEVCDQRELNDRLRWIKCQQGRKTDFCLTFYEEFFLWFYNQNQFSHLFILYFKLLFFSFCKSIAYQQILNYFIYQNYPEMFSWIIIQKN